MKKITNLLNFISLTSTKPKAFTTNLNTNTFEVDILTDLGLPQEFKHKKNDTEANKQLF